jgi:hypothetical protein
MPADAMTISASAISKMACVTTLAEAPAVDGNSTTGMTTEVANMSAMATEATVTREAVTTEAAVTRNPAVTAEAAMAVTCKRRHRE